MANDVAPLFIFPEPIPTRLLWLRETMKKGCRSAIASCRECYSAFGKLAGHISGWLLCSHVNLSLLRLAPREPPADLFIVSQPKYAHPEISELTQHHSEWLEAGS
jgi:hypothetical protein